VATIPADYELDVRKARELIDGYVPSEALFSDHGKRSWFRTDRERRSYWLEHAPGIVVWARQNGFPHPKASSRYGLPATARVALWDWGT
jgi:hypothetical protein